MTTDTYMPKLWAMSTVWCYASTRYISMICTFTLCKETNCGKFISVYQHYRVVICIRTPQFDSKLGLGFRIAYVHVWWGLVLSISIKLTISISRALDLLTQIKVTQEN